MHDQLMTKLLERLSHGSGTMLLPYTQIKDSLAKTFNSLTIIKIVFIIIIIKVTIVHVTVVGEPVYLLKLLETFFFACIPAPDQLN